MIGYWLIWCSIIIIILYVSGFKDIVLAYCSKQELFIYAITGYFYFSNSNKIVLTGLNGNLSLFFYSIIAFIPLIICMVRYDFVNLVKTVLSGFFLGLVYCLYASLYLINRGYEPSKFEWVVYIGVIVIMLVLILERKQLLPVIIIAQTVGEGIMYWHQQGQYMIRIGSISWCEFVIFLFVSTICLHESLMYLANSIKIITHNKMKS